MATVRIELELPEELLNDAREFGVLTNAAVVELIQAEVDRRVMDFVNEEIQAYRAEKADQKRRQTPE
jgi:hypothetical protein